MKPIVSLATALLAVGFAHAAGAAVVGERGGGGGPFHTLTSAGLDDGTFASLSGGAVVTGPLVGPTFGGTFLSAGPGSSQPAVLTFKAPTTYFSFGWGSPDAANQFTVNSTGGSQVFTSASLGFSAANGNPNFLQFVEFIAAPGDVITSVSFGNSNTVDSFEAADFSAISGAAAVPEPGAWAMMLLGFGGLGLALRSHRQRPHVHL